MHFLATIITAIGSITAVHAVLGINCEGQKIFHLLTPFGIFTLIVSIGDNRCHSQGDILLTIYNRVLEFPENTLFEDGQHIACFKHTCAFYQNLPDYAMNNPRQVAHHLLNLMDNGW